MSPATPMGWTGGPRNGPASAGGPRGWHPPAGDLTGAAGRFAAPTPTRPPIVRLLDAAGRPVTDPGFAPVAEPAGAAELLRDMALIRRFDIEGTALQRKGQLGLWAPLLGQEAIQVGIRAALGPADHVFPSHREHGLGMLMGVPLERLLAIFCGAELGDWDAERLRFHYYSMVVGAHTLHAVGYAMGQARDAIAAPGVDAGVSLVLHGDGAISEGDVNEAYIFATGYRAPVVFCCVNNQWAISEPVERQSRIPLYQRAWGFGMPGVRVDGNDVLAVQAVTGWALERARAGLGPTLIEADTYRLGAHTTSDDPTRYRSESATAAWQGRDPIMRLENWLRSCGAWDDTRQAHLDQQVEALAERVRATVQRIGSPGLTGIFDRVLADGTADLRAQQRQAASGGIR